MKWKQKAMIQQGISRLPDRLAQGAYFALQKRFGGMGQIDHLARTRLEAAAQTWSHIRATTGENPVGARFLEIGTGRMPIVPIGLWLMGAEKTITVDLNTYLRDGLTQDLVSWVLANRCEVTELLAGGETVRSRMNQLAETRSALETTAELFELLGIDYRAPADAAATELPDGSIDFVTSNTVLEHIAPDAIAAIMAETERILSPDGLCVHFVDYTDHFSHSDSAISTINFLQYSEQEWNRYAGNSFMYMNRLRHGDYGPLLCASGLEIRECVPSVDNDALALLESEALTVDKRFSAKDHMELATSGAWFVLGHRSAAAGDKSV